MSNQPSMSPATPHSTFMPPTSAQPVASPFLDRLIHFLLPYFSDFCPDLAATGAEILETLASYGARTRSEMLNAAQIIVYGLSALDTLHETKTTEMSPSMRLRFRGCANNLNRSGQQNEQSLAGRLAHDPPEAVDPAAEPIDDLRELDFHEAIQQAQAKMAIQRDRLPRTRPAARPLVTEPPFTASPVPASDARSASEQEQTNRAWSHAMMDVLAELGMPVQLVSVPPEARAPEARGSEVRAA
jgi:hypothetical protein